MSQHSRPTTFYQHYTVIWMPKCAERRDATLQLSDFTFDDAAPLQAGSMRVALASMRHPAESTWPRRAEFLPPEIPQHSPTACTAHLDVCAELVDPNVHQWK